MKISFPLAMAMVAALFLFQYLFYIQFQKHSRTFNELHSDSNNLGITTLITSVKAELIEAEKQKMDKNEASMFTLEDFDIEIQFVVKSNLQQTGKANFEFVVVDNTTNIEFQKLHKLKLHMKAVEPQEIISSTPTKSISHKETKVIGQKLLEEARQ